MALLDTNPLAQLFGQEQYGQMKTDALNMGALTAIAQLLAASGAQARPVGTGQAIGQALLGGYSGYQSSMDKSLKEMLTATQIGEMVRKQKEAQQIKSVLAGAAQPVYEQTPASPTYEGEDYAMGGQKLVGMKYDMKSVIPTLQALGRFDLIKDIGESQKAIRQSGIMADGAQAPSPFAPYLNATNPAVRQLATQLQTGFERGIIDEETAYKRLDPLAKMEQDYVQRVDKQAEGKKPTEAERNASGFAQRMEFSENIIKKLEDDYATQMATKGSKASVPYPTVGMSVAGSLPFIGDFARSKFSTDEQAQYRQAQENWVRANLRKESGAAIGADEMEKEIQTYFPTAAELSNPKVIAQKSQARQVTMDSMKKAAGNAYKPFDMTQFMQDNGLERRK
jgi:hypothetical protein